MEQIKEAPQILTETTSTLKKPEIELTESPATFLKKAKEYIGSRVERILLKVTKRDGASTVKSSEELSSNEEESNPNDIFQQRVTEETKINTYPVNNFSTLQDTGLELNVQSFQFEGESADVKNLLHEVPNIVPELYNFLGLDRNTSLTINASERIRKITKIQAEVDTKDTTVYLKPKEAGEAEKTVNEIRRILDIPAYKVNEFTSANGVYILMENVEGYLMQDLLRKDAISLMGWGELKDLLTQEKRIAILKNMGKNIALTALMGIPDAKDDHYIVTKDNNVVRIDNEAIYVDDDPDSQFSLDAQLLEKTFVNYSMGDKLELLQSIQDGMAETFENAIANKDKVQKIINEYIENSKEPDLLRRKDVFSKALSLGLDHFHEVLRKELHMEYIHIDK